MRAALQHLAAAANEINTVDVSSLSAGELRELLVAVQQHLDQLQVAHARALQHGQDTGAWLGTGARSMSAWLSDHTGAAYGESLRKIRLADTLERSPELRSALHHGTVSRATAEAMFEAVCAAPTSDALSDLVSAVAGLDPKRAKPHIERWRLEHTTETPEQQHERRWLRRSFTHTGIDDGMIAGSWRLPVLEAREVLAAISHLAGKPCEEDGRSTEQRMADGFIQLGVAYSKGTLTGGREAPTLLVTVSAETLAGLSNEPGHTAHGDPVSAHQVRHLAEDALVRRVVLSNQRVVELGTAQRFATDHQFHALVARDGGCRWPGCDLPATWCEVDHLVPAHQGGPTTLENLVLWCRHHHHEKHRPGVEVLGDAHHLQLRLPSGTVLQCPPRTHQHRSAHAPPASAAA